ncbi:MAG: orotate phosphoribosyltransferase [Ignavibacteria bacterium]|nr:orotate phosphoribosyltransferase [Ignavibacteria bacterium]
MDREKLGKEIFSLSLLKGEFKLRSGKVSNEYFDKYQFESRPEVLQNIVEHLIPLLPENFDVLAGLEIGGIPLATALSMRINKPVIFVRKKAKEYGTRRLAEGIDFSNKTLVVIEDVVTSGGQVAESIKELRRLGAICSLALCVIDREEGGIDNLARIGVELRPLFSMSELKKLADEL